MPHVQYAGFWAELWNDAKGVTERFLSGTMAQLGVIVAFIGIVMAFDISSFDGKIMNFVMLWFTLQTYTSVGLFVTPLLIDSTIAVIAFIFLAFFVWVMRMATSWALVRLLNRTILKVRPVLRGVSTELIIPHLQDILVPALVTMLAPFVFEAFLISSPVAGLDKSDPNIRLSLIASLLFTSLCGVINLTITTGVLQPQKRVRQLLRLFTLFANGAYYIYYGFVLRLYPFPGSFTHLLLVYPLVPLLVGFLISDCVTFAAQVFERIDLVGKCTTPLITFIATALRNWPYFVSRINNTTLEMLQKPVKIINAVRRMASLVFHFAVSCVVTLWAVQAGPSVAAIIMKLEHSPDVIMSKGVQMSAIARFYDLHEPLSHTILVILAILVAVTVLGMGILQQAAYVAKAWGLVNIDVFRSTVSNVYRVVPKRGAVTQDEADAELFVQLAVLALTDMTALTTRLRSLEDIQRRRLLAYAASKLLAQMGGGPSENAFDKVVDKILRQDVSFQCLLNLPLKPGIQNMRAFQTDMPGEKKPATIASLDPLEINVYQIMRNDEALPGILGRVVHAVLGERAPHRALVAKVEIDTIRVKMDPEVAQQQQQLYIPTLAYVHLYGTLLIPLLHVAKRVFDRISPGDLTGVSLKQEDFDDALHGYDVDIVWKRGAPSMSTNEPNSFAAIVQQCFLWLYGYYSTTVLQWRMPVPGQPKEVEKSTYNFNEDLVDNFPDIAVSVFREGARNVDDTIAAQLIQEPDLAKLKHLDAEYSDAMQHLAAALRVDRTVVADVAAAATQRRQGAKAFDLAQRPANMTQTAAALERRTPTQLLLHAIQLILQMYMVSVDLQQRVGAADLATVQKWIDASLRNATTVLFFVAYRLAVKKLPEQESGTAASNIIVLGVSFAQLIYHMLPSKSVPQPMPIQAQQQQQPQVHQAPVPTAAAVTDDHSEQQQHQQQLPQQQEEQQTAEVPAAPQTENVEIHPFDEHSITTPAPVAQPEDETPAAVPEEALQAAIPAIIEPAQPAIAAEAPPQLLAEAIPQLQARVEATPQPRALDDDDLDG